MKETRSWRSLPAYLPLRTFTWLLGRIPRPAATNFCRFVARRIFSWDRRHREIGLTNLRIAFPEKNEIWRRRILRESYENLAVHVVEVTRLERLGPEELRARVEYEDGFGLEHYRAARESSGGMGILFLTAHLSAWELLPAAHAVSGGPLSFVVRPLDNPDLDRWMTNLRSRFGNEVISKFGSFRGILRRLRQGRDIGLLIDQNVQEKDGVFVPFLGHPSCTSAGPAILALKTGAQVIAGFIVPGSRPGHYRIRFYPPTRAKERSNWEDSVRETTRHFNHFIEEVIREYPAHWLWGHRRFQTQRDGESPYHL